MCHFSFCRRIFYQTCPFLPWKINKFRFSTLQASSKNIHHSLIKITLPTIPGFCLGLKFGWWNPRRFPATLLRPVHLLIDRARYSSSIGHIEKHYDHHQPVALRKRSFFTGAGDRQWAGHEPIPILLFAAKNRTKIYLTLRRSNYEFEPCNHDAKHSLNPYFRAVSIAIHEKNIYVV